MKSGTTGVTRKVAKRRIKIPTITLRLPIHWASALINGDDSGLDDEDRRQIAAMEEELLTKYISFFAVDVGEADFCSHHDGMRWGSLAGDCATYTFHVDEREKKAASKATSKRMAPTVENFLHIFRANLIQYDKAEEVKALKKRRHHNQYALGHYLEGLSKVDGEVKSYWDSSTPDALNALKSAITRNFNAFPPREKTLRAIDETLKTGKGPSYPVTAEARKG